MLKFLILAAVFICGLGSAQAENCVVRDSSGADYHVSFLSPTTIDVVTDGAGWILEQDPSLSREGVDYFLSGQMTLFVVGNTISLYSGSQGIYYFQNQPCALTAIAQ
ncbi:MAG: hypothetical protein IPJ84_08345 [Bdellovibrionales bacterium]|nr:hypothetical protein [Bdellovibrionales bacterium]